MTFINDMSRNSSRGVSVVGILAALALVALMAFFGMTYKRWEGQAPSLTLDRDVKALGRNPSLGLTVEDAGAGLKQVAIRLKQKDQEIVLVDESFANGEKAKKYDVGRLMDGKVHEGPATLIVTASDNTFRGFGGGNRSELTKDFTVD